MRTDAFSLQFSFTDNFFFILRQTTQAEMSRLLMLKRVQEVTAGGLFSCFLRSLLCPHQPTRQPTNYKSFPTFFAHPMLSQILPTLRESDSENCSLYEI